MDLERLDRKELRLIVACAAIAAVSLYVGVRYFFYAFPEASIEFRLTRDGSAPVAEAFASHAGLRVSGMRHAAVFGYDEQAKTFLERELGVPESNRLLESTIRLWRWQHRWFTPLKKEEVQVEVTTKGEPVGLRHLLEEEAAGADLAPEEARGLAERFLSEKMSRPLEGLVFLEGSRQKRPHRTDHSFTWRVKGSEVKGADYRVEVSVAGDSIASYSEFLKLPDAWVRDYKQLRSRNELTGEVDSVLLLLTALAMVVTLVTRLRKGGVRWKAAGTLGGVTFVLIALSRLNSFPSDLYGYDTTTSFGGFVLRSVLLGIAIGAVGGAAILLIAASAEPVYRESFPGRLSLTSLLRRSALRTKEFFLASVAGLTATCFFFAYENIFYIIANRFGAWAPRDVSYSDLLSTSLPWIYVLFFGWFPAISEEFVSRMFSIPFFSRFLGGRLVAIPLAAFIWGFGHATYPNQPFWIRGLEVGLAGILFGLIFLRFGIVAVVICHFSVDALYTAFVLIRSPNPYYVVSGALSAGIFGVLFLFALAAYAVKGGFLPASGTNEEEREAEPEPSSSLVSFPAAAPAPGAGLSAYRPLSFRVVATGLVAAVGFLALRAVPVKHFGDWVDFRTTRPAARQSAETFLRTCGFDLSGTRSAVVPLDRTDPTEAAYALQAGGLDATGALYREKVPTPLWRARFFRQGQLEEYLVSVNVADGQVTGFERKLPDDASGATLPAAEARVIAERFARERGQDPSAGTLKEQRQKDEKARRDHTLVWEYDLPGAREAKVRYEIVVQGDRVGSWTRGVKIPEEWERERERKTVLTEALRWLKVPLLVLMAGAAILAFIRKARGGEVPWRFALGAGAAAVVSSVLAGAISLDAFWQRYDTSTPEVAYRATIAIGILVWALLAAVAATLVAGMAGGFHPRAASMFLSSSRRLYARDALLAALIASCVALGLPAIPRVLEALLPSGRLIEGVSVPSSIQGSVPLLSVLAGGTNSAIFVSALAGILAGLLGSVFRKPLVRVLLFVLFVLSFLPSQARRPPEYLVAALSLALGAAAVILLARFVLRDNPLAWFWSAGLAIVSVQAAALLSQSARFYRGNGWLALMLLVPPVLWLLWDATRGRPPSGATEIEADGTG